MVCRNIIKVNMKAVGNWLWKMCWKWGDLEGISDCWLGWLDVIQRARRHGEGGSRWVGGNEG